MRRFFCIILDTLALISLLLAVVLAGLWVRSYWRFDAVSLIREVRVPLSPLLGLLDDGWRTEYRVVESGRGRVRLTAHVELPSRRYVDVKAWQFDRPRRMIVRGIAAGSTEAFAYWNRPRDLVLIMPHWFLVAAFSVLPLCRFARRTVQAATRWKEGVCRSCGYDLRATPDRCPECGAVPKGATV